MKKRTRPRPKLGRPALVHKPLARTFMLSEDADDILNNLVDTLEPKRSRSDVLDAAIKHFYACPHA